MWAFKRELYPLWGLWEVVCLEDVKAIVQPLFAPNQMCADQDRQVRLVWYHCDQDDDLWSIRWRMTQVGPERLGDSLTSLSLKMVTMSYQRASWMGDIHWLPLGSDIFLLPYISIHFSHIPYYLADRRYNLQVIAGNKGENGIFAPIVRVTRDAMGTKEFNQLRGKAISLHSQVIKDFCKQLGVDTKQVQGLIRLAKKNGEWLGFLA